MTKPPVDGWGCNQFTTTALVGLFVASNAQVRWTCSGVVPVPVVVGPAAHARVGNHSRAPTTSTPTPPAACRNRRRESAGGDCEPPPVSRDLVPLAPAPSVSARNARRESGRLTRGVSVMGERYPEEVIPQWRTSDG